MLGIEIAGKSRETAILAIFVHGVPFCVFGELAFGSTPVAGGAGASFAVWARKRSCGRRAEQCADMEARRMADSFAWLTLSDVVWSSITTSVLLWVVSAAGCSFVHFEWPCASHKLETRVEIQEWTNGLAACLLALVDPRSCFSVLFLFLLLVVSSRRSAGRS